MRHRAPIALALFLAMPVVLLTHQEPAEALRGQITSISRDNGVLYDGCHDYEYQYSIDTTVSTVWKATVILRGPTGRQVDRDDLDSGFDKPSGFGTQFQCGGSPPAGRYKVTLEVKFRRGGDVIGHDRVVDRFHLRRPRTRTSFTVSDLTPSYNQVLTFGITSRVEGPNGYIANQGQRVALEAKRANGWIQIPGSLGVTGQRGVERMKGQWNRRSPLAIRATTLADRDSRKSASRPKTLR